MWGNILLNTSKFAKEGYVLVYDKEEVNIYDETTTEIEINSKEILTGYFSENIGMWRIPLKDKMENKTTNALVLNRPNILHAILNVHEIPSS